MRNGAKPCSVATAVIEVRRDADIYRKEGGWFSARWHFSFDEYRDPENSGFGNLRVFNDDRLVPGAIWPLHPHRDIEGLTYVVEGTFRHEDDRGGDGVIPAGSVQRMTLGSGAWHSEQNASAEEPMRFIQMWIVPSERGLPPSVEQKVFTEEDRTGRLLRVISPEGGEAVRVHGDASVYVAHLPESSQARHELGPGKGAYLYLIDGEAAVDGSVLHAGDAVKVHGQQGLEIVAGQDAELILVDVNLAM